MDRDILEELRGIRRELKIARYLLVAVVVLLTLEVVLEFLPWLVYVAIALLLTVLVIRAVTTWQDWKKWVDPWVQPGQSSRDLGAGRSKGHDG